MSTKEDYLNNIESNFKRFVEMTQDPVAAAILLNSAQIASTLAEIDISLVKIDETLTQLNTDVESVEYYS